MLYGHAKRLAMPEHEVDATYVLLFTGPEKELIPLDIWSNEVIVTGEEYVDERNPLIKKLEEFKEHLARVATNKGGDTVSKTPAKQSRFSRLYVTLKIILNILKTAFMRPGKVTLISRETGDIIK